MMVFVNACYKENIFPRDYALNFLKLLNPIVPHMTEELWSMLGNDNTIANENWPIYDEEKTIENNIEIGVQVNGKLRATISVVKDADKNVLESLALKEENVINHTNGKEIVKIIVVPNRIVNIVVK